jgi:hypothetical protein
MATKGKKSSTAGETRKPLDAKATARAVLRPSENAAAVVASYASPSGQAPFVELVNVLGEEMSDLSAGKMDRIEGMLLGQAHALQSIFASLALKASSQEFLTQYEVYLRYALKAQSQCRATLETLAAIKNPPIVYARQANVTTGPQQINNGTVVPSQARENEKEQTQLSGGNYGLLSDTRASGNASRVNPALETLGESDRAEIRRR